MEINQAPDRDAPRFSSIPKPLPISIKIGREIQAAIEAGKFPVGSRLPGEHEFASQFGASRASVREALSALQFAGYIKSTRGSGSVVISSDPAAGQVASNPAQGPDPAPAPLPPNGHRESQPHSHHVLSLLEARLILEPQTVALAATDPDPLALDVAARLIQGMRLAVGEPAHFHADTDLRVHAALVEACRNPYLVEECKRLLAMAADPYWLNARRNAWADEELLERWVVDHQGIHDAISAGRPTEAKRISRAHLFSTVHKAIADREASPVEQERLKAILRRFGDEESSHDLDVSADHGEGSDHRPQGSSAEGRKARA